jgi:hypothetical protein
VASKLGIAGLVNQLLASAGATRVPRADDISQNLFGYVLLGSSGPEVGPEGRECLLSVPGQGTLEAAELIEVSVSELARAPGERFEPEPFKSELQER